MVQIWLERLIKWQRKYRQLMNGRYGRFDEFNRFFLMMALLLYLFRGWILWYLGEIFSLVLMLLFTFRFFSKKIYPRLNENQKYLQRTTNLKKFLKNLLKNGKESSGKSQAYVYFECPNCVQKLRAPQGKGRIRVTCSRCQQMFEKTV